MSNVATSMTTSRPIGTARSDWPSTAASAHRSSRRWLQPSTTNPPAAAVAHRGEVGDKLGEAGFVADRVAADHRVAHPRAVGDGRRAVGVEVIALRRLHGERRERVTLRHVHQSPNPGQVSGIRPRRRSATSTAPPADTMSRLPSRSNTSMCAPRPASTAASASQACAAVTGLPRKMPRAISATAVRRVSDQASRPAACQSRSWSRASRTISQQNRAEHRQRADPAGGRRIDVDDDPLAGPQPRSKMHVRFAHSKKVTPANPWHPGST